ncbi:multicopper oxidase domain-containing protein [Brevibacillus agri]|uniref:multicopper oxidase domain-containing protein n=1 Tax=Brevibacillus agri TaxID=51101 RepID=UPI001EE4EDE4|nr:multicopper oxidase domain-containing protein [Brevibacillus agri]MCG5254739.1 multicopper oxidase domain-containing protein [Brevibacillus agri]
MGKNGQRVKLTLTNPGKYNHPIHLHGHFFQVLTKYGQTIKGSPLLKDTLNVRPGETYEIAFIAENDGNWMLHCQALHHAAACLMTEVKYEGFTPAFSPEPTLGNMPE